MAGGAGTGPGGQPGTEAGAASSAASRGPALRAAGHGARRPDRGEFLFLKQGGTILLERQ